MQCQLQTGILHHAPMLMRVDSWKLSLLEQSITVIMVEGLFLVNKAREMNKQFA